MRINEADIRCYKDGSDRRPACFANACGRCVLLTETIKGKPCPFYKSKKRFVKEQMALQEGNMVAYRSAKFYDFIKETE